MKFELKPANRKVSDEELLDDLRKVALNFGGSVTQKEYDEHGRFSFGTLRDRFGGWNKILLLAGLEIKTTPRGVTEEKMFQNLEEVWTKLGRQPKSEEMQKPFSKYSRELYRQRYGTWMKALEKFVDTINTGEEFEKIEPVEISELDANIDQEFKHKTKRDINWRMRFQVLARDNFRCVSCGLSPATALGTILHVDHIKP
jgi:hypothetical protein